MAGYSVEIDGLDEAIRHINKKASRLETKMKTFSEKLAEIGVSYMNLFFRTLIYDGTPDVHIGSPEWVSKRTLAIPVTGSTVAFIEFGTGVYFTDRHPRAAEMGAIRGEYGKKQGKNETWQYFGEPGSLGWYKTPEDRAKGLVTTHGNPANSVMYNASKQMRMRILEIARSVFADD